MKSQLLKYLFLSLIIGCVFSSKAQVVINEVNVNPPGGTSSTIQSVKVCTASTSGTEYVELYNKTDCPIDISCYIIGWNQGTNALNGSFRFPSGTTIPAKGFISIGGPNSGATFNLYSYCSSTNLNTGNTRWYLNNGDGYVCLYNASGTAVDLVYWTFNAGETSKYGTDSEISDGATFIANPAGCSAFTGTMLPGPSSIPVGSGIVSYAGSYPTAPAVIGRITDGIATWTNTLAASINACNGTCNTLGTCVLPVELISFSAICSGTDKIFVWETLSELNNNKFYLEASEDGVNFIEISNLIGAGSSTTSHSYSLTILNYLNNYQYFRLKQRDYNGQFSYSKIIFSDCKSKTFDWALYPNPFNEFVVLQTPEAFKEGKFVVTDMLGQIIQEINIIKQEGIFEYKIDLHELPAGIYLLSNLNSSSYFTKKIVKTGKHD